MNLQPPPRRPAYAAERSRKTPQRALVQARRTLQDESDAPDPSHVCNAVADLPNSECVVLQYAVAPTLRGLRPGVLSHELVS